MGGPHGKSPPAKFGGHRHCGSEDMMFVVAEGQDSTCLYLDPPLLFVSKDMTCHAYIYKSSGRMHNNLPVCSTKDSRPWSHMSPRKTDGTYFKMFCETFRKKG